MSTAVLRKKNRVTIPMEIIKQTGLKENDPLKIDLIEQQDGYSIVIEPLITRRRVRRKGSLTLEELYENFSIEDATGEEIDWEENVGQEAW